MKGEGVGDEYPYCAHVRTYVKDRLKRKFLKWGSSEEEAEKSAESWARNISTEEDFCRLGFCDDPKSLAGCLVYAINHNVGGCHDHRSWDDVISPRNH